MSISRETQPACDPVPMFVVSSPLVPSFFRFSIDCVHIFSLVTNSYLRESRMNLMGLNPIVYHTPKFLIPANCESELDARRSPGNPRARSCGDGC